MGCFIVNGGERKKRLQYLLENDRELKKALREDAEEMNLHNQSNYLDDDIQRLRRKVTHPFPKFTVPEFDSVKGAVVGTITECCKDIACCIHR